MTQGTGLFCYRSSKTSFRTWQVRQPSNDWVKKEYPVLSSESSDRNNRRSPVLWDEPIGFCPLSLYVPEGYVVDFLGASGIQSAKATCQVPMRKHASVYKTKRVIVRNNRKSNARFISENVRNTACHLIVIRRLNVIATFFEFKHHKGRQFSIDFKNNKQFPLVLWTGMHCISSSMPTNLYVNRLLPFTNSSEPGKVKVDYTAPISFLPRSVNVVEKGYSVYYVYIKERGGCSPQSLSRWFYKGPVASTSKTRKYGKAEDPSTWNDVAETKDLVHLVVITRDEELKAPGDRDGLD